MESEGSSNDRAIGRRPGRNIILCFDGTGNSASSVNKSNVWRMYQALDQSQPEKQIAYYIRGVGTSNVSVLKVVGEVFGFGVASNVRHLYSSLCQNYQPASDGYEGDRIYIFGFSRGAFTARLLAGLINSCGILDRNTTITVANQKLPIGSKEGMAFATGLAYASFRRAAKRKAGICLWHADNRTLYIPG